MSFRGRRNFRKRTNRDDNNELESDNPVIKQFQVYSAELLEKHDRHERLGN